MNNYLYNNYAQFQYNPIFSQSVNKKISSSSVYGPSYSNINCNSTTSFSSAYDNNNNNNILNSNYNNSYIFRDNNINTNYNNYDNNSIMSHDYQGFNNSYIDENKNFVFDRSKRFIIHFSQETKYALIIMITIQIYYSKTQINLMLMLN